MIIAVTELYVKTNPEYEAEVQKNESLGINAEPNAPNSIVFEFKKAFNVEEIVYIEENEFTFNGKTTPVTTVNLIGGQSFHAKCDYSRLLQIWSESSNKSIIQL